MDMSKKICFETTILRWKGWNGRYKEEVTADSAKKDSMEGEMKMSGNGSNQNTTMTI
jgi:hypothetical protein